MQEKLVIYLHSKAPHHPSWVVLDANGIVKEAQYQGDASILANKAINKIVQVIVPAHDILLTNVVLQKMNRSRLLQVLPYTLEEQLIDEVDSLHFAIGNEQVDDHLSVAVVSNTQMKQWLDQLALWHIKPDVMMSSIYLLPWQAGTWHVVLLDDLALIRTSFTQGIACDAINLSHVLNLALTEIDKAVIPQHIILHDLGELATIPTLSFPHITISQKKTAPEKYLLEARAEMMAPIPINLLQGVYAVKHTKFVHMSNVFKITTYLVIVWVGLILLYPLFPYLLLKHRINEINLQISHLYQYHFPQASSMIAPKARMADKLQTLKTQTEDQPLFIYLGYLGKGMLEIPTIQLKRLDYQQHQLTVELSAATSQDFSTFTDFLTRQGLTVQQQNASLIGSQMNATLLIE